MPAVAYCMAKTLPQTFWHYKNTHFSWQTGWQLFATVFLLCFYAKMASQSFLNPTTLCWKMVRLPLKNILMTKYLLGSSVEMNRNCCVRALQLPLMSIAGVWENSLGNWCLPYSVIFWSDVHLFDYTGEILCSESFDCRTSVENNTFMVVPAVVFSKRHYANVLRCMNHETDLTNIKFCS